MTQWANSGARWPLLLLLIAAGCGGQRVGNEEYFAGAPLPPPEPERPGASSAKASSAPAPSASAPPAKPTCHDTPPPAFPRCNAAKSNAPCVYGDIGGCLVQCEGTEPPVPAACPPPAANGPMPQP